MAEPEKLLWEEIEGIVQMACDFIKSDGPPFNLTSVLFVWDGELEHFEAHMTMFTGKDKDKIAETVQDQALKLFPQAILVVFTGWTLGEHDMTEEEVHHASYGGSISRHPKARYGLLFTLESAWGSKQNFVPIEEGSLVAGRGWEKCKYGRGRFGQLLKPLEELQ